MIYLRTFQLSQETVRDPYIYPYNVFAHKECGCFLFDRITILYGNNASGKSTMLNLIAHVLNMEGREAATHNPRNPYFLQFAGECFYGLGEDEEGSPVRKIPADSRYIKSEDIMYEVKKIQQEAVLKEGYLYEHARRGYTREQLEELKHSGKMAKQIEILQFAQEKYSNGETALQILDDCLHPDALYLLDEPEVSLSPQNQVLLADKLNRAARFLDNQFIIATHSPFLLGTLSAKIYNLDSPDMETCRWNELDNVRYFFLFFENHREEFL